MWTHRFAIVTAVLTWFLLLLSGIAHRTDSSLACLDWPLCSSPLFTAAGGGVPVEQGRRLVAALVGFFTVVTCGAALGDGRRSHGAVPVLAALAFGLAMLQGVVGDGAVFDRLPTLLSWGQHSIPMLFFATLIAIAGLTRHAVLGQALHRRDEVPRFSHGLLLLTTGLAFLQMVLGGIVRHSGGGLACLDIPLCRGSLLPLGEHPAVVMHAAHRLNGLVFALCLFVTAPRLRSQLRRESDASHRVLLTVLPLLTLLQIGLGILSVWSYLGLFYVAAHLGIGALILGGLVLLCLRLRPAREYGRGATGGLAIVGGQGGVLS